MQETLAETDAKVSNGLADLAATMEQDKAAAITRYCINIFKHGFQLFGCGQIDLEPGIVNYARTQISEQVHFPYLNAGSRVIGNIFFLVP